MIADENVLARAAAAGDSAAFAALIERVYDRLFALSFRLTGSRAEAEDLTHDICTALPRKITGFRGDARFSTWLYRVAVNAAHDRRRRAARHQQAAADWGEVEQARRAEAADARAAQDWLTAAMTALPDEIRDTLALTLGGMSQAEAAEVLDIAPGTVSWRISDAKRRLRAMKDEDSA